MFPVCLALYVVGRLTFFFRVQILFGKEEFSVFEVIWLIFCLVIIPVYILAHLYQFFWSEYAPKLPSWIPNFRSILEGFWRYFVVIFSAILALVLHPNLDYTFRDQYQFFSPIVTFLLNLDLNYNFSEQYYVSDNLDQETFLVFLWIIITAYFYHFRIIISRLFLKKDQKEAEKKNKNQP